MKSLQSEPICAVVLSILAMVILCMVFDAVGLSSFRTIDGLRPALTETSLNSGVSG